MNSDTLETDNNENKVETFIVSNLSDNKSFPESFLKKSKTVSSSQINGHFGWGGLLLNIPDMRADTLGWFPNWMSSIGSWNADIADPSVPMVLYSNPFSNSYAKKSSS